MHIGLIGGIGPAATEFYYRHLTAAHARARTPLDLTIVHAQVDDLLTNMRADRREEQAALFAALTRRLQAAGAQAVAVTSIAGHFCIREFERVSPLPVISIVPAVRSALERMHATRVGLLGTRVAMSTKVYGALDGVDVRVPGGDDLAAVDREYLAMGTAGTVTEAQRELFFRAGRELRRDGAEVIVLAGTDFCLAFDGRDSGFPTLDCALAHVEAIAARTITAPSSRTA